jgi:hypothetical protein
MNTSFLNTQFQISNEYEGFYIKANESSKKDAEKLSLEVSKGIFNNMSIFFQSYYILNSDSKTIGLNEAEKLNGNLGISVTFPSIIKSYLTYGIEKNKQVSIVQEGPRFYIASYIDGLRFSDVNIKSNFVLDRTELKDGRRNSSLNFLTRVEGNFLEQNTMYLSMDYFNLRRDYIVFPIYIQSFFETRTEQRTLPAIYINYNIFDKAYLSFSGQISYYSIHRWYNFFDPTNSYSAVERTLVEQSSSINVEVYYRSETFSPKIGFNFYLRNEENTIDKKFDIDNQSFNQILTTESQKNNNQSRANLYYQCSLDTSKTNTINIAGNISILRYNTPSELNDDDRDEFSFLSTFSTNHIFSKYFSFSVSLNLQLNHLVLLKSTRSSLNNWNRIINLSTSSTLQYKQLFWKPTFEIFSNYLVYDFETNNNVQSYAFRQFVYKDTLMFYLSDEFSIFSNIVYKYSERGTLFWKEFSMTKELDINELFIKTMLFTQASQNLRFGLGGRIYNIKQRPIGKFSIPESYSFYSFSPETEIRISLGKNNVVFLQGWYELKFWNYKIAGENPNFMLTTIVNL